MSGLVKNQIVKQLARFTKNLSPSKISVKFLKGEGELHNLELDETTLAELLELPPWIRLTKATCNRISAKAEQNKAIKQSAVQNHQTNLLKENVDKIHWTRLKTDPICLNLDCVEVNMEATDGDVSTPLPGSLRTPPSSSPHQPPIKEKAPNRYGFVEKVVDGMFVQINSVVISFKFQAFLAKFQMSRLVIRSTTPEWQPDDLRLTRVKDETRGEVLTFKEITWQTLRIDANALYNVRNETWQQQSNPLRLITSQSSLHLTIKKRLDDCAVLSARLELLLDDILWVLTRSQLQALSGLLHSVNQVMSQSKIKKEPATNSTQHTSQASHQQTHYTGSTIHERKSDFESLNALFTRHDVRETSYHLRTGSIDLHLCDDSEDKGGDGGAMHFKMNKLSVDYFPYHLAGTSRNDWPSHNEASLTRAYWVSELLSAFRNSQRNKQLSPQRATQGPHRARSDGSLVDVSGRDGSLHPSPPSTPSSPHTNSRRMHPSSPGLSTNTGQTAHSIKNNIQRPVFMLESCFVIRCEEFFIMPVTTSNGSKDEMPFLSSDKKALFLPSDMPAFQLDFTQYYYPGSVTSAVPTPNLFIQLNPIQLTLDTATCLWFSSFMRSIVGQRTWSKGSPEQAASSSPSDHIDIRIEALMPKLVIPCPSDPCAAYKDSRPQGLQVQVSQVFITNSRIGNKSTQTDMLMFLQPFLGARTYTDFQNFPSLPSDVQPLPNSSWVNDCSLLSNDVKIDKRLNGVCQDISGTHQPSQVWCLSAEQVWLDFLGIDEIKKRPVPFIDAVPVQIWIATPLPVHDHNTTVMNPTLEGVERTNWLTSNTHRRTTSEILPPKRKGSEPVIAMKSRTSTGTLLPKATYGLHNSNPDISSKALDDATRNGPPPAYESRNEPHKPFPVVSDPPPPYDTLTHYEPNLAEVASEEVSPSSGKISISGNTPNGFSESERNACQEQPPGLQADLSLLMHIPQSVKIQLDHFQFLFLMRLQETLVKLQEDLERDRLRVINTDSELNESKNGEPSLFFSILTQGVDLNVVLPPAPDRDGSREERTSSENTSRNASSLSSYLDTGARFDSGCQTPDIIDCRTSLRTDSEEAQCKNGSVSVDGRDAKSSEEVLLSPRASSVHSSGRTSSASAPDSDGWLVVPAGDKSASESVKSRADSEASNFSNQLGSSISKDSSSKDVEDEHKEIVKMVSIFSIEGDDVELGIHFIGNDTVVKILCPELKWEELGVINFEKYLNRKSSRKSLTKTTIPSTSEETATMRIRMEFGPCAEHNERKAAERGFMHIKVNGVHGSLLVSTLGNMAEWIEDEVVVPPMPFSVELNNSRVSINNDLPPTLVSAPLPVPVDLTVENISIRRTHDGVLHIRPMSNESNARESEQASAPITREESISASQLSLSDSASICSRTESLENEKQSLMSQMAVSRATLQSLQEERDALLKTIERLQQELSFSNREQDLLQERMTSFQKGGKRGHR